jgi:hypothetical protein
MNTSSFNSSVPAAELPSQRIPSAERSGARGRVVLNSVGIAFAVGFLSSGLARGQSAEFTFTYIGQPMNVTASLIDWTGSGSTPTGKSWKSVGIDFYGASAVSLDSNLSYVTLNSLKITAGNFVPSGGIEFLASTGNPMPIVGDGLNTTALTFGGYDTNNLSNPSNVRTFNYTPFSVDVDFTVSQHLRSRMSLYLGAAYSTQDPNGPTVLPIRDVNSSLYSFELVPGTVAIDNSFSTGSFFRWDLSDNTNLAEGGTAGIDWTLVDLNTNTMTVDANAAFVIGLNDLVDFATPFWSLDRSWSIFQDGSVSGNFSSYEIDGGLNYDPAKGFFTFNNSTSTLNWTAIPEPTSALSGILLAAGLMRRRRR